MAVSSLLPKAPLFAYGRAMLFCRKPSSALVALSLVIATACGGAPPPEPAAPAPVAPAAPPPPVGRGPSAAVLAHFPYDDTAQLRLYADVSGLLHTELAQGLVTGGLAAARSSLNAQQMQCLNDVIGGVKEVMIGAKGEAAVFVIAIDEQVAKPTGCLAAGGATAAQIEGATDAYHMEEDTIAHLPGLIIMGAEPMVKQAVKQTLPTTIPDSLRLSKDQFLTWSVSAPGGINVGGHLVASSERFRFDAEGDVPEALAARAAAEIKSAKSMPTIPGMDPAAAKIVQSLLAAVTVDANGKHLTAAFDLKEPVVDQARDLGAAVTLAIYAVRRYIADAKTAEARSNVRAIAKDYVMYWENEPPPGKPKKAKKLVSLPPVPKDVPKGDKYSSKTDDWKPWSVIGFSLDGPQYYQYEVKAAKDGKSAEVIARGDLNGDGKTSLFKIKLTVDPKDHALAFDPSIEETDPTE
jgi:type IV pilus assembly protein PilA